MTKMLKLIPDGETLVGMHSSDLAGYILETLISLTPDNRPLWNRRNFCLTVMREFASVEKLGIERQVGVACSTAWAWLEANSLICRRPDEDNDWFDPTPLGENIRDHQHLQKYLEGKQLPEEFLHPALLIEARPLFLQSRFETAVFEAFKSLEVAIREAAGLGHDLVGVKLARKAFQPDEGPLTDMTSEAGEREALMSLMAGALGSYKNPASHRRVEINAVEARDMIVLASHLMKIVDARAARA